MQASHHYGRPQKIARTYSTEISPSSRPSTSPLVVVRSVQRIPSSAISTTPISTGSYFLPLAYLSPEIGKLGNGGVLVTEVVSEQKEVARHSLQGRFSSVSLFKEYQNAAMADLLGIGEYRPGASQFQKQP